MSENLLVIDVGTSSVRAGVVDATGTVRHVHQIPSLPSTPLSGMVEFDASSIAEKVLEVANASLNAHGPVAAVGITNQRATTVVWDARTGDPIGPAIGWQDLRTVIDCLVLQAEGLRLAPNVSATKLKWLLDTFDPHRENAEYLRFGTLDTWVAWTLSRGDVHVTDASNAGVTGLVTPAIDGWDPRALEVLNVPSLMLPEIVSGDRRRGHGARRLAADCSTRRRSAGLACWPELHLARPRQDHLRHRRHAGPRDRCRCTAGRRARSFGHLPHRRLATRGHHDLGPRGNHAFGRVMRGVATR